MTSSSFSPSPAAHPEMGDADVERQVLNAEASETTPLIRKHSKTAGDQESLEEPQSRDDEQTIIADNIAPTRLYMILATAYFGVFLGAIDSTIIATLSGPISSEFKSLSLLPWLATAYLISNAACQPISGRLTDIFGRGPGLVFSNVFFAVGNLICGLAKDKYIMIAGRVIAGIGGGGLMSIASFLASDLVPLRKRGVIQGFGNLSYGTGAMLGGVFGGSMNDHTEMGWRLAFLVQVPPVVFSAFLVGLMVKVPPKASDRSRLARIDFTGVFLTVGFLVTLLLGLNAGGNLVPWDSPLPIAAISVSVVLLVGFWIWESQAKHPIIPVRMLLLRTIFFACISNLVCSMVTMMGIFYVPLYLQVIGYSATKAGLSILSSSVGTSVCSIGAGLVMKKTGKYMALGICDLVMFVFGVAMLMFLNEATASWIPSTAFFFVGGAYGAMLTITLLACLAAVEHSQQAVITSATYLFRSLGATIGITIGSTVYQNILKARLWERFGDRPDAAAVIYRIRNDLDELHKLPPDWYEGALASFMEAFTGVWSTMLGLSIIALICMSLMKQHVLHSTLSRTSNMSE